MSHWQTSGWRSCGRIECFIRWFALPDQEETEERLQELIPFKLKEEKLFFNESSGEGANYWVSWKDHGVYLFHSVPIDASGDYIEEEAEELGQKPILMGVSVWLLQMQNGFMNMPFMACKLSYIERTSKFANDWKELLDRYESILWRGVSFRKEDSVWQSGFLQPIAWALGRLNGARAVGRAMKYCPESLPASGSTSRRRDRGLYRRRTKSSGC